MKEISTIGLAHIDRDDDLLGLRIDNRNVPGADVEDIGVSLRLGGNRETKSPHRSLRLTHRAPVEGQT